LLTYNKYGGKLKMYLKDIIIYLINIIRSS